ncbi:ninein-like protein isoform X1 [Girardinichthys multiradiatus]|uniref:ninein-like protein isoform X1 n=1 Tax=Girardinichthys multiradiatus TaxID=208333 RepID=UPI001FAE3182|nr:ninein-like protein isoform X1 [Girardinichthys multiradiatus]
MEEEEEHSHYVAQLKAEFKSCDTTATGFLDRDELTELCRKLQLDAHLPLLLDTLLGERPYGRVNFEEFKDGFVAILSRCLDFSTSEDNSSYLEPDIPQEVKPKFVKGTKRYGRRSCPETLPNAGLSCDSEESTPSRTEAADSSPPGVRRAKLRRSTSLESVESLKSDEETGSARINQPLFQNKADEEDGGGRGVLTAVCDHLALQEVDELLRRLDADLEGRVTVREFSKALWSSAPTLSSTPVRSADLQRALHRNQQLVKEEGPVRSAAPSLLLATVGQRVLSRLDDGSGCTSPERVAALWTEEGIRNSQEILQTLDFPLEERLSLADLTLVLDNELLVSGNGIHQAALISYKTEIQHLQEVAEQACRERDKLRTDLDLARQRNLQLVREVDDRHASMETLNESKIRDLEQDFRERLASLRCHSEQESEALLQQVERERSALQEELQLLRAQEAELQEELSSTAQEKQHLEDELNAVKMKLSEAESSVQRLQRDLDQLLHHKFGSLDLSGATLSHEERFSELLREYELQRRELQDRNDELSSELELLKSHRSSRKSHLPAGGDVSELSWSQQHSDDSEMKSSSSSAGRKRLLPGDKMALSSLDLSGPSVSIHTELALQQLKENHEQELQQLQIQLETQGNYYERQLDMMKQNIEVERKDISQAFKLEISELEEQKAQVELQVKQLKETVDRLQTQVQQGGGGRSSEVERRIQWERAELEQNYAREISNLVQRLSGEKDQLEAEMKLKMDQEVMRVREEMQTQQEEKRRMKEEVCSLQEAALRSSQTQAGLEEDLEASRRRSSELQTQLEESITYLESQEVRNKRLASEKGSMEGELQQVRKKEAELLDQMDQLKAELTDRSYSSSLQTVTFLRSELEKLQAAPGSRTESISRLTTELDSLKMDRDRFIQDLKEQAMAVDTLQLQLDAVSEELDQRKRSEAALQEALLEEQNRASELQSSLTEEKDEVTYLSQENSTYMRLVYQLSTQIVEMEEEISSLREHLRGLSLQLNDTADLVLDLRRQLNSRTSRVERLQSEAGDRTSKQVLFLQRALQDSQNQLTSTQEDFDREKRRLAQRLMELENLVLDLEDVTEAASPHRTQLEEVRSENAALQERLKVLQQEVQNLEDEAEKKRRRLQEMEREHERSREEEERLHRENSRYREEVLDLSSRNLKLSSDNGDLSNRLRGEQESVRMLQERLATVSKEQDEGAVVQRLQEELSSFKEKLSIQSDLEAELSGVRVKLQKVKEEKEKLQRDAENWSHQVEQLHQQVVSMQAEADLLRFQLLVATQEKLGHAQEVTELHRKLREALSKVEEMQADVRRLMEEKEELHQNLQEETHILRVQNQELQQQLSELQVQDVQVQKLSQEHQNLRSRLDKVETARTQAHDQVLRSDAALSVAKAQHLRQRQQLQEQVGCREQVEQLQLQLQLEQMRSQQLEEKITLQVQHSRSQISMKQEQFDKTTAALKQQADELEVQLKALRLVLQDKVQEFKEQMEKNKKMSSMLKDLYVENSQLVKALQITEQRQKQAEKKNFMLEEKVGALNELLKEVVATVLAT